ncbi:MAG TPA: T9SS type A sorting domain-containing protein, partial [Chitinophagales bacterium]|nr:T9SS type A sorting domain-containing protein [Chitinophagales bacterium]
GAFIDNLDGLPMQYKQWILDVEPNAQALLENKYCGSTILGIVNISGAVLDTAWIKEGKEYPPLMSQHGTADPIVPFNFGKPFNIPTLPNLMGSYLIDKRYKNLGQRSELETWISYSHVPFVGGFNLDAIFGPNPFAIVFNPFVLDSTKRHITNFCYSLIDCDALTTTIKQHLVDGNMSIFPNPSNGNFSINIPKENRFEKWNIEAYDISGKQVFQQNNLQHTETIHVQENLGKGLYFIKLYFDRNNERFFYLGKVSIF